MCALRTYSGEQTAWCRVSRGWRRAASARAFALLCGVILAGAALAHAEQASPFTVAERQEVLTLQEAASWLQVSPEAVEKLATWHCLPGQRIGTQWRFSRTALLAWLSGMSTSAACTAPSESAPSLQGLPDTTAAPGSPLSAPDAPAPASDLSRLADRDRPGASSVQSQQAPAESPEPKPIGEQPTNLATAEKVFLRDQGVLLKAGELTLELGLFYSNSEQQDLRLVPSGAALVPSLTQSKRNTFTSLFTARYGLLNNLQLFANFPLHYQTDTITLPNREDSDTRTEGGDITLGLRRSVLKEGVGVPEVLLSAEGVMPTGESSYGIGGGITLVKIIDPVVLFGHLNYRRTFSRAYDDVTRLQPENTFSVTLGYALALNDTLTINAAAAGIFTPEFPNAVLPARERFSLQFGLTSLPTKRLYVEPTVSFGLNGPGSNVTIGVSLPYIFAP